MTPDVTRVVVLAPNWLGDAIMALPALADIRRHYTRVHLSVAARTSIAPIFGMVAGVDEVVTLPGRGGFGALTTWRADADVLGAGRFDLAVLLPNAFAAALISRKAGVPERWGFVADGRRPLLTRAVAKPPGGLHQAAYYQALVEGLGMETGPRHARVDATEPDRSALGLPPDGPYVVFAPGAAYGRAKQWLPERFAELAAIVTSEMGASVVLVGSKADGPVCAEIASRSAALAPDSTSALTDSSGRTSLVELASVLKGAWVVVSNDSGAMHLAAAVGARVVAVFGSTNERGTAPLTRGPEASQPVILTAPVWCRPCMLRECPIDHRCMTGVSARSVASAVAGT